MTLVQTLAAGPITIPKTAAESWGVNQISATATPIGGVWGVGFSCVCLPRATSSLGVRFMRNTTEITRRVRQFRIMPTMERELYLPFVTDSLLLDDVISVQFYADGAQVSLTDLRLHLFR
jgi:hypothetical protein